MIKSWWKKIYYKIRNWSWVRKFTAWRAACYYGFPAKRLVLIGVTGTNGKTSTVFFIKNIFEAAGLKIGTISTSGYWLDKDTKIDPPPVGTQPVTTPDPFVLHKLFAEMNKRGDQYCVMEVASLAYKYKRLYGLKFKGAILTNFSFCHHIPMHGSFEKYKQAKQELFRSLDKEAIAVLPCDDEYFEDFKKVTKAKILTFGFSNKADVYGEILKEDEKLVCQVKSAQGEFILRLKRDSVFNYKNALAAAALSLTFGIDLDSIKKGLEATPSLAGRGEIITTKNGVTIMIDKANTIVAWQELISDVKNRNFNRLIGVYGNFSEFPLEQRQRLAQLAIDNFDFTIITIDDSNTCDPQIGIDDFINYVKDKTSSDKYLAIFDRREAIKKVIEEAKSGDLILILGRGDEEHLNIQGKISDFSDKKTVEEILQEKTISNFYESYIDE